jgi:hypothetical protein
MVALAAWGGGPGVEVSGDGPTGIGSTVDRRLIAVSVALHMLPALAFLHFGHAGGGGPRIAMELAMPGAGEASVDSIAVEASEAAAPAAPPPPDAAAPAELRPAPVVLASVSEAATPDALASFEPPPEPAARPPEIQGAAAPALLEARQIGRAHV